MYNDISAADCTASNIEPNNVDRCAEYVRRAIERGGISLQHTRSAKDYDPSLLVAGFHKAVGSPVEGDVIMIQPTPGHPHGYVAIYDGSYWISDFRQLRGFYPGPACRSAKPACKTYHYH